MAGNNKKISLFHRLFDGPGTLATRTWIDLALFLVALPVSAALALIGVADPLGPHLGFLTQFNLEKLGIVMLVAAIGGLIFFVRRYRDVSREFEAQRKREAVARLQARRDTLTGLHNRLQLNKTLAEEIEAVNAGEAAFTLLLLDLDQFRPVNDLYGRAIGDEVLKKVGERIKKAAGEAQCIARIGGDEFAVLLSNRKGHVDVENTASRILRHFEPPFEITGKPVQIGASIGIAAYPSGGDDAEALFRHADVALYKAKQRGRNQFYVYSEGTDDTHVRTPEQASDIRRGLRDDEFVPYFQPIIDLGTGKVEGVEVLARWEHPVHGLVGPDHFIPCAEALDLVGEITFQVARKACTLMRDNEHELFLAVNVSQSQLRDQWLPERILAVLTETGYPPSRFEVEITENSLVEDVDVGRAILMSLKNQGIRISLDDFGTGYSSLVHIRDLPLDKIKIDRSFVTSLRTDIGSAKIVSGILGLVTSLGLPTVAEGIESEEVAKVLGDLGCTYGQGFLYSRPIPGEELTERFLPEFMAARMRESEPVQLPAQIA